MISMDTDIGSAYRVVIQHPHRPWEHRTAATLDAAMDLGRAVARAELTARPDVRQIPVSTVALCQRCQGHGTHAVRSGLFSGGGQAPCRRCDGSGVAMSAGKEYVRQFGR